MMYRKLDIDSWQQDFDQLTDIRLQKYLLNYVSQHQKEGHFSNKSEVNHMMLRWIAIILNACHEEKKKAS